MALKSHGIFKEKLSGGLKNDKKIWLIFMEIVESLNIFTLKGSFC